MELTVIVWDWKKPEPSKSFKPSTIEPLLSQSSRALEGLGSANLVPHFFKAQVFGHEPGLIPNVNIPLLSSLVQTRIDDKTPFKRNKQIRCWVILATISWTLCHNFWSDDRRPLWPTWAARATLAATAAAAAAREFLVSHFVANKPPETILWGISR